VFNKKVTVECDPCPIGKKPCFKSKTIVAGILVYIARRSHMKLNIGEKKE
jgi:hypothetical protein